VLHEKQVLEITFMNNGRPLPDGMDTRHYVLRGEKAGVSGNTGIGGYHIKEIMDHVEGSLEVLNIPEDEFPVQIKLQFPINYESSL
jgi:sensor histidine kinase regulating citrate/malate metabolism